jgi:hypothetical protein
LRKVQIIDQLRYSSAGQLNDSPADETDPRAGCPLSTLKNDEIVKSQKFAFYVIPAKAGIYSFRMVMDSGSSPE